MIRHCTVSTTELRAIRKPDGSWTLEGVESEGFLPSMDILQRWAKPFNSTFFLTVRPSECIRQLDENETDFTNLFIPIETISPHYYAPQTMIFGQNQFITGYNTSEWPEQGADTASVFSNFELWEPEVYLCSLMFMLVTYTFVLARVLVLLRKQIKSVRGLILLARIVLHHIGGICHHSNDRFRLMTFLYAVFCFYIVTTFLCIYKTSHVIAERPFYPTSYQQSLDHKSSLASFYDQFVVTSTDFKSAAPGSIKRQLWDKLVASGSQERLTIDLEKVDFQLLPQVIAQYLVAVVVDKGIGIASSITSALPKSLACGFSPEGQLYILKIFTDPSEGETVYGYAIAKQFYGAKTVARNFQKAFEGHIVNQHYVFSLDVTRVSNRLAGTSKRHQWRQYLACHHEDALIPDVEVHPVSLPYFHSFFFGCLGIWIVAFLINLKQIVCAKHSARQR